MTAAGIVGRIFAHGNYAKLVNLVMFVNSGCILKSKGTVSLFIWVHMYVVCSTVGVKL